MKRAFILLFGAVSYVVFFATFLYLVAFVGNLQQTALVQWLPWLADVVPYSVSAGRATGGIAAAVAIDLGLLLVFGLQHSIMARLGFKAWLTRHVPEAVERSIYVLTSSALLIVLFWQWRPITDVLWAAESAAGQAVGWAVFGLGFAMVLVSTFLIDHFELFGLRQVWSGFRREAQPRLAFVTPWLYRYVRHPLYLGFLLAFWGGPLMTVGHFLFAAGMTVYVLVAVQIEERDLERAHGEDYARYRERVPMIVPVPGRRYGAPEGG